MQCSLSRRRMVLAATRRRRGLAAPGKIIGAAAASIAVRKGSPTGEAASIAGPELASTWPLGGRLDRCEPFPEVDFDKVGIGVNQRVLGRKVLVDPIRGFVGGLQVADGDEQLFPQRR